MGGGEVKLKNIHVLTVRPRAFFLRASFAEFFFVGAD